MVSLAFSRSMSRTSVVSLDSPLCIQAPFRLDLSPAEPFSTEATGPQGKKGLNTEGTETPTPRGNADGCEKKGVAGRAIRKNMKTKDRQESRLESPKIGSGCERRILQKGSGRYPPSAIFAHSPTPAQPTIWLYLLRSSFWRG